MTPARGPFGWAIVGPGKIAHRLAEAVTRLDGTTLVVVHGRNADRAAAFARHWCRGEQSVRATTSLDDVLADDRVHAVYIASPHTAHAESVSRCLAAGKPVLCEKPICTHAAQAKPLFEQAREARVFLMEAMWTRFLPAYAAVADWLRGGAIGEVRAMQSSFCFHLPYDAAHRLYDPRLGGGALLDVGIYNLSVTRWVMQQALGACPALRAFDAIATLAPTGVDQRLTATLHLDGGVSSQFVCAVDGDADNTFRIHGSDGHIELPDPFWETPRAVLVRRGKTPVVAECPFRINGFEYEAEDVMRCVADGRIESPVMPHAETLATLDWMDRLRERVGVRYPFEG